MGERMCRAMGSNISGISESWEYCVFVHNPLKGRPNWTQTDCPLHACIQFTASSKYMCAPCRHDVQVTQLSSQVFFRSRTCLGDACREKNDALSAWLTLCINVCASHSHTYMVPRGLEPRTLRLLAVRSNQLSYETYCVIEWQWSLLSHFMFL